MVVEKRAYTGEKTLPEQEQRRRAERKSVGNPVTRGKNTRDLCFTLRKITTHTAQHWEQNTVTDGVGKIGEKMIHHHLLLRALQLFSFWRPILPPNRDTQHRARWPRSLCEIHGRSGGKEKRGGKGMIHPHHGGPRRKNTHAAPRAEG